MLTLAKVTGGEAAASYYEGGDDYYADEGRAPSAWWGAGAKTLGLFGPVDGTDFKALLDGELPDGSTMHRGGEGARRAGTDLTFSAPKSVSMQAMIAADARLIDAHDTAVSRTLAYVENRLAAFRITIDGETRSETSRNLLVARFRHDLSRDTDPQLHTHAVAINATLRPDGQWRALDAEPLYRQQKLLGALYRAELAREVQTLGYAVRLTHDDGRFELANITDAQVTAFSQRSQAISAMLAKRGLDRESATAAEREIAALGSRRGKGEVDRTALWQRWTEKSLELGIDYTARPHKIITEAQRAAYAESAVEFAIDHLTERQSIVRHEAVVACALGRVTGTATLADIENAISARVADGQLVADADRYTTAQAQLREQEILAIEVRGRAALKPIVCQDWLPGTESDGLNTGQREAARLILTSPHRVVAVQGRAGTGKTHLLTRTRDSATLHGWRCVGLAPSSAAARELGKTGIDSQTIAAFLAREGSGLDPLSLVVLDEAGMVSAVDMHAVLRAVERANARIVLVGDTRQLKAVQAGMPLAQLQRAGMATAHMGEILRQTNVTLKAAVEKAAEGQVAASLKLLTSRIVEIDYAGERYTAIARHYVALAPGERDSTLIVAGTRAAREYINAEVRAELGLQGQGFLARILRPKDLTEAQCKSSLSYRVGDMVQMQKGYDSLGLRRGELATVVSAGSGRVGLRREDGQCVEWRPVLMPHVSAYQVVEREMAVGERVRVTANDYAKNLINGEVATVTSMDTERGALALAKGDGSRVSLDLSRPLHIEHGYCVTVHSAQGRTCDRVLIDADVGSAMANESLFYVAISRARKEVLLFTDDRALLPVAMSRDSEKSVALDIGRAKRQAMQLSP